MPEGNILNIELFGELASLISLGIGPNDKHPLVDAKRVQVTLVAGAGFAPRSSSEQNLSPLPLPIHRLSKGLATSSANTLPHHANQFSPDLSTSFSNPRSGVHEAAATKL